MTYVIGSACVDIVDKSGHMEGAANGGTVFDGFTRTIRELVGDFIEDAEATDAEDAVVTTLRHDDIEDIINGLEQREQDVIRLRYGLDDGVPRTLDQIGRRFGLSRERVRQIEREVMAKLRDGNRADRLREYAL